MDELKGILLEDTFVLTWGTVDDLVVFEVEFSLWPEHPQYQAPKPDEWTCYRKGRLVFEGVSSVKGLRKLQDVKPGIDANAELDYGNIDALEEIGKGEFKIAGNFGEVNIVCSRLKIEILPDDIDMHVAYLVMLNGTEEASLHEALADIVQRKLLPEPEAFAAAQCALQFLVSGGWLVVAQREQGHTRTLSGPELESIITSSRSWAAPDTPDAAIIGLEPTSLGAAAWKSGFPILGLSEKVRRSLMLPQPGTAAAGKENDFAKSR